MIMVDWIKENWSWPGFFAYALPAVILGIAAAVALQTAGIKIPLPGF